VWMEWRVECLGFGQEEEEEEGEVTEGNLVSKASMSGECGEGEEVGGGGCEEQTGME